MTATVTRPVGQCVPAGPLAPPRLGRWLCRCGVELHAEPCPGANDWQYVTDDGEVSRDDRPDGLRADPAKWWRELARDNVGGYSNLSAAIQLGCWSWTHCHHPHTLITPPCTAAEVPFCCDQPMWASPAGWVCRGSKVLFPYQVVGDG